MSASVSATPSTFELAVEIVLTVAGAGRRLKSDEIAEALDTDRRRFEPLIQLLVRTGILDSIRGPWGGYRLARQSDQINLADIMQILIDTSANDSTHPTASSVKSEVVLTLSLEMEAKSAEWLRAITIASIMKRAVTSLTELGFLFPHRRLRGCSMTVHDLLVEAFALKIKGATPQHIATQTVDMAHDAGLGGVRQLYDGKRISLEFHEGDLL